ncbi:MAG: monomethylamine:corrinoid methyltransferase [Anaerolineaceae bacterium]|nr:monomethylamine:corrinoid methyltransferase [Anaerolineaceae bacterium]
MIHNYLDILDRAHQGQKIDKSEWDQEQVMMTSILLQEKYDLRWQRNQVVPNDPALADRLFAAALEMIETIGVLAAPENKVIRFSRDELIDGTRRMPQTLVMGSGKDARTLYARRVLDERAPIIWAGNPGCPTPEELFLPTVMSWMQEPIVDLATCGSLTHIDGYPIITGAPIEVTAIRRELSYLREGLRRVGRPNMGMLAAQSSVSEIGDLAAAHPDFLRAHDSHLVAMFNELIIDQSNMTRVLNARETGIRNASLATVMVGGLAGGPAGAALAQAASFIAANWVCWADYHLLHPIHIRHVATSTREVMWVQGIVEQAFARNAPCIIVSDIYPKSGAGTRELLYETAANAIAITVSGGHLEGVGSADGNLPNGTGLEARWMGEIGHAVTREGLDLDEANRLVGQLLGKYEAVFKNKAGNPGLRFDQAYDLKTLKPVPAWQAIYDEVKAELRDMGLRTL